MKTRSKQSASGFTLIELLVAMAITTIIISILVSITALSLDAWNRSRSEVRAARQGKAMIDSMARDFESLVVRKGNSFEWLHAESNPTDTGPNNSATPNAVDLIFFTAATDRYEGYAGTDEIDPDTTEPYDQGGDVSTVGYQLVYKNPISADVDESFKTFVLYRKLLDPDKTFGVGGADGTLGESDLETAFNSVISGNPIDEDVNFICENVYEFTVTFHVRITDSTATPAVKTVRIPVSPSSSSSLPSEFSVTGAGNIVGSTVDGTTAEVIKGGQLSAVEISLTVLTDFGLKQLRARTFSDPEEKAEFIGKNSYQYSKLVQVPGS